MDPAGCETGIETIVAAIDCVDESVAGRILPQSGERERTTKGDDCGDSGDDGVDGGMSDFADEMLAKCRQMARDKERRLSVSPPTRPELPDSPVGQTVEMSPMIPMPSEKVSSVGAPTVGHF